MCISLIYIHCCYRYVYVIMFCVVKLYYSRLHLVGVLFVQTAKLFFLTRKPPSFQDTSSSNQYQSDYYNATPATNTYSSMVDEPMDEKQKLAASLFNLGATPAKTTR